MAAKTMTGSNSFFMTRHQQTYKLRGTPLLGASGGAQCYATPIGDQDQSLHDNGDGE